MRGAEWCIRRSSLGRQYLEYLEKKEDGPIISFPFNLETPTSKPPKGHSSDPDVPVKGHAHLLGLAPNPNLHVKQPAGHSPNASITKSLSTSMPQSTPNEMDVN